MTRRTIRRIATPTKEGFLSFQDIPLFPRAHYQVNVEWRYLETQITEHERSDVEGIAPLNMNPDFQREHVWHEHQQRAYVEYCLQGGEVGRVVTFNCKGWGRSFDGPYEIVDGKQRIEAVRKFMRSELKAFGQYFKDFGGVMRMMQADFLWSVCALETREEVLQLYLNINAGGTPHTKEELDRVRALLTKAKEEREKTDAGKPTDRKA